MYVCYAHLCLLTRAHMHIHTHTLAGRLVDKIVVHLLDEKTRPRKVKGRTGEMTQWLRVMAGLLEGPGSIPSIHMAVHKCL